MLIDEQEILIVEDDKGLSLLIEKCLKKYKYNMKFLSKGKDAVKYLTTHNNAFAIIDYNLNDINADQIISNLKSKNIDVDFLIFSGIADIKVAVDMLKIGARDFLVKDLNFIEILPDVIAKNLLNIKNEKLLKNLSRVFPYPQESNTAIFLNEDSKRDKLFENMKTQNNKNGVYKNNVINDLKLHNLELEIQNKKLNLIKNEIEKSRKMYMELYDNAPVGYFSCNKDGKIIRANKTFIKMIYTERDQLIYKNILSIICENSKEDFLKFIKDLFKFNKESSFEISLLTAGNKIMNTLMQGNIISTDKEELCKISVIDISERKKFENELLDIKSKQEMIIKDRTSELKRINLELGTEIKMKKDFQFILTDLLDRYKRITNGISDYIYTVFIKNGEPIRTIHNDTCEKITGYKEEDFLKNKYLWIEMIPAAFKVKVKKHFNDILKNKESYSLEHQIKKKSGEIIWIRNTPILHFDDNNNLISYDGVISDITESKNIQLELIKKNKLLEITNSEKEIILNNLSEQIYFIDKKGKIISANKAAKENYKKIIFGKYCYEVLKDSRTECKNCIMQKQEIKNKNFIHEFKKQKKIYRLNCSPVLNNDQSILGFLLIAQDITELRKKEEEIGAKEMQLIQTDKLASLGILSSSIAHEINNPNNYILLNANIFTKLWNEIKPIINSHYKKTKNQIFGMNYDKFNIKIKNILAAIKEGSMRIKSIVENLREFVKPDYKEWNNIFDVNEAIRFSVILMDNMIKKYTDNFDIDYGKNIPNIKGNMQQFEQVIINLLINACQALKNRKNKIFIESSFDHRKEFIIINITDEGVGISSRKIKDIFKPFFTTKDNVSGTGLGLTISNNIIKKFNGELIFKSKPGMGTSAIIKIPIN